MTQPRTENALLQLADQKQLPDDASVLGDASVAFLKGAYSFPHDWWLASQWSLGIKGVYGDEMQRRCQIVGDRLELLLVTVQGNSTLTYRAVAAVVRLVLTDELTGCVAMDTVLRRISRRRALLGTLNATSAMAGRYAGGVFTYYAATGGRFGGAARAGVVKPGMLASNLVLASFGAVIRLAINTGGTHVSAADLALSIIAGLSRRVIDIDLWADLIRAAEYCAVKDDASDRAAFEQLFRSLSTFNRQARAMAR